MFARCFAFLLALSLLGLDAVATDSPSGQWRGTSRDGHIDARHAPAEWPDELSPRWSIEVGEGHSSPVSGDGIVYTLTRRGGDEVVSAIDADSGETRWEQTYSVDIGINPYADAHGRWPRSTPVLADRRLVTLGADATLSAWDAATGELAWRHAPDGGIDVSQLFCGSSMSPIIDAGRVVVHVGDDSGGELIARSLDDGEVAWRTELEGPGYASPVRFTVDGDEQLVTLTMSRVVAVGLDDGEVRWSAPFDDRWNENIVTPIVDGERVIVAGVRRGTSCLEPRLVDGEWSVEEVWHNPRATFYMSSPVLADGALLGFMKRRRGQLVSVDATTGDVDWAIDEAADNAAVLRVASRLVIVTTNGELLLGRATADGFEEERRYELTERPVWAHPVITRDGVIIKDATHLIAWGVAGTG